MLEDRGGRVGRKVPSGAARRAVALHALLAIGALACAAGADAGEPIRRPVTLVGDQAWSFLAGYGRSFELNDSVSDLEVGSLSLRWSRLYRLRGDGVLRARPTLAIEAVPLLRFETPDWTSVGAGFHLVYEHRFAGRGRWLPVLRVGGGYFLLDGEVPSTGTRGNFSFLFGGGVDVRLGARGALVFEYRFVHWSNGGLGEENPGVNGRAVGLGYAFFPGAIRSPPGAGVDASP